MLHTTELGESGSRVVFCHGLFGQGRNFTAIGKALAADHRVTLVDMPDHGRSPWSDRVRLPRGRRPGRRAPRCWIGGAGRPRRAGRALDGRQDLDARGPAPPGAGRAALVVDVAPVPYDHATEFDGYIAAMRAIDLDTLQRGAEAEDALREAVPNADRAWVPAPEPSPGRRPLAMAAQPRAARPRPRRHHRLARGALAGTAAVRRAGAVGRRRGLARTCTPSYVAAMHRWFPRNRRVTVKGAGHWVHSEQPEVFVEVLRRFLDPE